MSYLHDHFQHKFYSRFTYSILLIIGLACCCLVLSNQLPLRLNFSGSMPRGVYWISHIKPKIGNWVAVCLPDKLAQYGLHRGYLHRGSCANHIEPLFKQIAAISGDVVSVNNNGVIINSLLLPHSATLAVDTLQRPLTAIPRGIYLLKAQQVWLYGTESNHSWDSRYFGTINISAIQGVVKPLFIFNKGEAK